MKEYVSVIEGEVKKREIFGHAVAGVGQNLIFGLWSSYMLVFYTDVFGISAAAASIIMLITRIWDGINDPIMGFVADKTRTKWGRFRPYLLFMAGPIVLFFVLNFSSPNLPPVQKIIYAGITYCLMSMAFTSVDVPYWTLPAAMSKDLNKRTTIISVSTLFTTIASVVVGVIAIPMVTALGDDGANMERGYMLTALFVGITGACFYLIGFAFIREHVVPQKQEKISFPKAIRVIVRNEPLLLVILSMLISTIGMILKQNLMVYYAQYNLGNIQLVPIFTVLMLPGMIIGVALSPILVKKVGQKMLFIAASIFSAITNTAFFFAGYTNIPLVCVLYGLSMIPFGINMIVLQSMITNTIEYAEYKFGQRSEGLITSTRTMIAKFGMALGAGLSGVILTVAHYVPNVEQSAETLQVIHFAFTLAAAILALIGIIPMFFNKLTEKRHAEIVAELESKKSISQDN